MKKLCALLLILAALLSACAFPAPETAETKTFETEPAVAVRTVDFAPEAGMEISAVAPLTGDRALVSIAPVSRRTESDGSVKQTMQVVDVKTGGVVGSADGGWWEIMGQRKNGQIVILDMERNVALFFSDALALLQETAMPEGMIMPRFSRKDDCFYVCDEEKVLRISPDGVVSTALTVEAGASVERYDPEAGLVVYTALSDSDVAERSFLVYDPLQGRAVFSAPCDGAYELSFLDGALTEQGASPILNEAGDYLGSRLFYTRYDPETGKPSPFLMPADGFLRGSFSCPWAASATAGEFDDDGRPVFTFFLAELKTGRTARPVDTEDAEFLTVSAPTEKNRFYFAQTKGGVSALYVINPAAVEFDGEPEPFEKPERIPYEPGPSFEELRAEADRLEKAYDVRILLGDEVKNTNDPSDFHLISLTESQREPDLVRKDTKNALNTLDLALSYYPTGFFGSFKENGRGGVRFLLVEDLQSLAYETFTAAGLSYTFGAWYNVALEVDGVSGEDGADRATVHHELWHTVEEKILRADPYAFDGWEELDPDGFSYGSDFDSYWLSDRWNDYLLGSVSPLSEIFFVSSYSTVTPQEDRATLIEALFDPFSSYAFEYPRFDDNRDLIRNCPRLTAKLQRMEKAVRSVFGGVYWAALLN